MHLVTAQKLANRLIELMQPHCVKVEIAGSIRRLKPEVKDIEIVAIAKDYKATVRDLFNTTTGMIPRSMLVDEFIAKPPSNLNWIKCGTNEIEPLDMKHELSSSNKFGINRKYWRGYIDWNGGIKLDLFLATPENFGIIMLIRTGSKSFNLKMIEALKNNHYTITEGRLYKTDRHHEKIDMCYTPDEASIFRAANMTFIEPQKR